MYAERVQGELHFRVAGIYLGMNDGRSVSVSGIRTDEVHIGPGFVGEGHFASFLADDAGIQGYFLIEEEAEK